MNDRRRDDSRLVAEEVDVDDVLAVFAAAEAPVLTTEEVAVALPIDSKTADRQLNDMREEGIVDRKQIGDGSVVWWTTSKSGHNVFTRCRSREKNSEDSPFEQFRGIMSTDRTAKQLVEDARTEDSDRERRLMHIAGSDEDS